MDEEKVDHNTGCPSYPVMGPITERQIEEELDRGRIYRLNDRFFKFLFGGEDRKPLFLDLVNTLVFPEGEAGFVDFEYADRELSATRVKGKSCYLDILAIMADGTQVEVEVQVKDRGGDYPQRSTYYLSALHASQMHAGDGYGELKRTISIHILGFRLFEGDRFRRAFSLCDEETGEKLSEDLRLIYLEVPKYVKHGEPRSRLEYWLMYLAGMEAKKMPETMASDPMIGQALDLEKLFLQSREERLRYLLSYKAMRDEQTLEASIRRTAEAKGRAEGMAQGMAEGIAQGMAQGEAKGEAKARAETARRMLEMNLAPDQIAQATGLSLGEIEAMRVESDRG